MTTLPPAGIKEFPEDSIEKKVYNFVDSLDEYIPVPNDRNRLSFGLVKYIMGEGDEPAILVKSTKVKIQGIEPVKLAEKLSSLVEPLKADYKK